MAIRLITGKPGSGKTFLAVKHLRDNYYYYSKKLKKYCRKKDYTIISNIDSLKLKHLNLNDVLNESGK